MYGIKRGPFTQLSSELIYENRWGYRIWRDEVKTPGNTLGEYNYLIKHEPVVGIVALTPNNDIILVYQYRYPVDAYFLEIPAGTVEIGDTPENTVRKELKEETGATTTEKLIFLGHMNPINGFGNIHGLLYLALNCERTHEQNLEPSESIEVRTIPVKDYFLMLQNSDTRHVDPRSAMGVTNALWKLGILHF